MFLKIFFFFYTVCGFLFGRCCSCDHPNLVEVGAELIGRECFSCIMKVSRNGANQSYEEEESVDTLQTLRCH
jgi:hypothetical protein